MIFACGGQLYESVLEAAEDKGGMMIGADIDQCQESECILTSTVKGIADAVILSLDDYYSYIKNAAVLVLPFDENFGARTSGTIIDALSNKKCCIGTAFPTMKGYAREYRAVCRVYRTIPELEKALAEILGKNSGQKAAEEDFNSFEKDRSMDSMKVYMEKAFMGYI